MALISRVILALLLVLQTLPGIAGDPCSAMRGVALPEQPASSDMVVESSEGVCPCCVASTSDRPACGTGDEVAACRCELTRPERTQSPTPNQPGVRFQSTLAILPSMLDLKPLNTAVWRSDAPRGQFAPKRVANSIQSVLCMWTV